MSNLFLAGVFKNIKEGSFSSAMLLIVKYSKNFAIKNVKKIIATFWYDNFVILRNLIAEAACFNNSEQITEVFAGYFRIPDGSPFRKKPLRECGFPKPARAIKRDNQSAFCRHFLRKHLGKQLCHAFLFPPRFWWLYYSRFYCLMPMSAFDKKHTA